MFSRDVFVFVSVLVFAFDWCKLTIKGSTIWKPGPLLLSGQRALAFLLHCGLLLLIKCGAVVSCDSGSFNLIQEQSHKITKQQSHKITKWQSNQVAKQQNIRQDTKAKKRVGRFVAFIQSSVSVAFLRCSEKVAKLELTFCEQMFCLFSLSRPFGVRMFVGCKCHCYQLLLHSWTWWECGSPGLPTNTDPVPTTDQVDPVLGNTKKNPTLLPYIYKLYVLLFVRSKLSLPALCAYLGSVGWDQNFWIAWICR